ncbi:uncharacterized protein LOC144665551 isoform X2 [Oculina patagonica]
MMYLGIFVFAACTTFGLVQSEKAPFMCPTCRAHGENAVSDCEANIEYKPCLENVKDPVCVLYSESKASFFTIRSCRSREAYNVDLVSCQTSERWKGCAVAMCETSGCKAEFPASAPLICPICYATGGNADSECEANIENYDCFEKEPVCALYVDKQDTPTMKARVCINKTYFNDRKTFCETTGYCSIIMCDTSGCKAEFPTSA